MGREVERIVGRTEDIEALRREFPVPTEHAGCRVCDGMKVLAARPFPVTLDPAQAAAIAELRAGVRFWERKWERRGAGKYGQTRRW
jgi:hypothetical protein